MRTRWFLVALAVALGALGTLQALTVPIGDRTGAFVDETRHFARTVGAARYMTRALGWAPLQIFDYQLQALITRPDLSVDAEARAYERYSRSAWWLSDLYFVYGVPQMLLPAGTTLVTRFLVSRLFLLLFGIALIPVIYATNRWLFGPRLLALAATATTVLMPSFVIFMVTLSTDAGAIVVMSVLLACAAWGWAQGWNRLRVYLLVLAVFMALVAKQTVWAALLAGGFFFGVPPIVRGLWRNLPRLPWELQVGFAALLVAAAGLGVQALPVVCCRAAYWYYPSAIPHDDITLPLREQANGGPVLSAIRVDPLLGDRAPFQYVAPAGVRELRGEWATVGAWVRAPAGQSVHLPRLSSEDAQPTAFIASGEWQFGSYAVQIDQAAQDLRVTLPGSTAVSNSLAFMKNTRVRHVRVVQQPEPVAKIEALQVFPVYGDAARSVGMPAELVASGATADGNSWLEWDFGAVQPIRVLHWLARNLCDAVGCVCGRLPGPAAICDWLHGAAGMACADRYWARIAAGHMVFQGGAWPAAGRDCITGVLCDLQPCGRGVADRHFSKSCAAILLCNGALFAAGAAGCNRAAGIGVVQSVPAVMASPAGGRPVVGIVCCQLNHVVRSATTVVYVPA